MKASGGEEVKEPGEDEDVKDPSDNEEVKEPSEDEEEVKETRRGRGRVGNPAGRRKGRSDLEGTE
jgi:hypothetical protein